MKRIEWFFAFVCLLGPVALAQSAQLSGVVKDKTGAVVPQAEVALKNLDTASVSHTKTTKVGFFIFSSVQPGRYDLTAVATGFDQTIVKGIKMDTAANVSQDLILQIKQGAETVTVTQQAALIAEDGTVSTVIDQTLIENMPLNGKDLTTLFELSPGTLLNAGGPPADGGGFSVDGQRPTANNLTIDNASANAYTSPVYSPNMTGASIATSASGGTQGILPVDALAEYRMDTSTYSAENGRTPGAQIIVRTRSGTNTFHGTLFENFRNQVLDDTDWFTRYDGLTQTPLRMNDFGGTFGGPIFRNRLFFFVAHDTLLLDQPTTSSDQDVPDQSVVQTAAAVFRPLLSAFPAGNDGPDPSNPGFDFFSASLPYVVRDHTTSVRIDTQLAKNNHAFFRANIAPSSSYQPGVNGKGSQIGIYTYTGGITEPIKTNILNELTVNHTSINTKATIFTSSVGGNTPNAIANNLPTGINAFTDQFAFGLAAANGGDGILAQTGPFGLNSLHQWNIVDALSYQLGGHTIKVGFDLLKKQTNQLTSTNQYEAYTAGDAGPPFPSVMDGDIDLLFYYGANAQPVINIHNLSLYGNDDWKVSRNLTVNAGLRWEYNPAASVGPLGLLALQGDFTSSQNFSATVSKAPLYAPRYDNFAPRVGFAWSPSSRSNIGTVIRGGLGIYFDTGQAATVAEASVGGYPYYTQYRNFNSQLYSAVNWSGISGNATAYTLPTYGLNLTDPHLISPRTYEWSLTLDQQLWKGSDLSVSYVGNDGEKLIGEEQYYNYPNAAGVDSVNTNFVAQGGDLEYATNQSHSNYQALQVQMKSKMGQRLDALLSYTWGHAEDNGSTDFTSTTASAPNPISTSAFDIRQMFGAAVHYVPLGFTSTKLLSRLSSGWSFDTIARLQTALPFTVTSANVGSYIYVPNADVVTGQPAVLHEKYDSFGNVVPGGKFLNWSAFAAPATDQNGIPIKEGDSPTNGYRLFGLTEWDLAASRAWKVWRNLNVLFRIDAYNLINKPNFASPFVNWSSTNESTFGKAEGTYADIYGSTPSSYGTSGSQLSVFQNGGPREVQLSLKLKF